MMNYLENKSIFREDRQDQSEENENKVNNWVKKWKKKIRQKWNKQNG